MDAPSRFGVLDFSGFDEPEPARVEIAYSDEPPRIYDLTGRWVNQPSAPPVPRVVTQRKCGTRARSSRGRSLRVRGSRRSTAAARSSSSDDPGLGDDDEHRRAS